MEQVCATINRTAESQEQVLFQCIYNRKVESRD